MGNPVHVRKDLSNEPAPKKSHRNRPVAGQKPGLQFIVKETMPAAM